MVPNLFIFHRTLRRVNLVILNTGVWESWLNHQVDPLDFRILILQELDSWTLRANVPVVNSKSPELWGVLASITWFPSVILSFCTGLNFVQYIQ